MNKNSITVLGIFAVLLLIPTQLIAQSGGHKDDPAVQRARADMEVAQDLGRLLGFIYQMVQDESRLALNSNQTRQLHTLITQALNTTRLDRPTAEDFILRIEDDILSPAQLLYTDRLFAARENTRMPAQASVSGAAGTGTPQGNATGRNAGATSGTPGSSEAGATTEQGTVTTFMNGGPYNPLTDTSRQQGQDIAALLRYLAERL